MIGTTGLRGLRIACVVGVHADEREQPQPVVMDIELDYDIRAAVGSDDIGDAVNYDEAARDVIELVERRQFHLIETMAEETASLLLARQTPVSTVRIEIRKPDAVPAAACAFVRLERSR